MSVKTKKAAAMDWTCAGCQVHASWMAGTERPKLPANWAEHDGEAFCLSCRRDRAAEAGLSTLGDDASRDERVRMRATSVIEFEVDRNPDRPDGHIAKACRTSIPAVRKTRERLGSTGPIYVTPGK